MCVCDEKSVWNVFFGNELAEVGRTKRRGSGASHFSLLCVCCLPVFLLSPMLIWSSPEKLFVWQESLSHWNEGRKLGKKKWANLRESKLTWGSSRPFDTFVVVTFIKGFLARGRPFSYLFSLSSSSSSSIHFGLRSLWWPTEWERERERMTLFFHPPGPTYLNLLRASFGLRCYRVGFKTLGVGNLVFPPTAQTTPPGFFSSWYENERKEKAEEEEELKKWKSRIS